MKILDRIKNIFERDRNLDISYKKNDQRFKGPLKEDKKQHDKKAPGQRML